ncbi:MAG: hypothetical protein LBH29_02825 [Elusimicrobiota bacterium]|nr:hypothetical protein [Elusimicrobiota bacterium]
MDSRAPRENDKGNGVNANTPGVIPSQDGIPVCYRIFTFLPFAFFAFLPFEKRNETTKMDCGSAMCLRTTQMTPGVWAFAVFPQFLTFNVKRQF